MMTTNVDFPLPEGPPHLPAGTKARDFSSPPYLLIFIINMERRYFFQDLVLHCNIFPGAGD
jgi:hypothetical protein